MVHLELKTPPERRVHERLELNCPCKVFDPRSGKYHVGMTWNLSHGGAMLEVARSLELKPGDRLFVGIAAKRRQALLLEQDMLPAQVIRALTSTTRYTTLALQFLDQPQAQPHSAAA